MGHKSSVNRSENGRGSKAAPTAKGHGGRPPQTFDDQLRQSIEVWLQHDSARSLRQLATSAGIAPTTLIGWHADASRSLRLVHAEPLARITGLASFIASNEPRKRTKRTSIPLDDQLRALIGQQTQYDIAKRADVPRSTLNSYVTGYRPSISCRLAYQLCRAVSANLITPR